MRLLICLFLCALSAGATTSISVADFGSKPGAAELHAHVITELGKNRSFQLVSDPAQADATLAGTGEIWVKGHVSLNPRNRAANDAETLYSGYLSVELKDKGGVTLWSWLATPHSASGNAPRDLAKVVVSRLTDAVTARSATAPQASPGGIHASLHGAGATFPQPVYLKWFESLQHSLPDVTVRYDAVGSEAGIDQLSKGLLDFAASDALISQADYFKGGKPKYLRFPTVLGAVVPIFHLPGMNRDLRFTPEILAGIYLGTIRRWNDPLLRAANPNAALPDHEITVVHRSDGSGTSYVFTDYLSKVSPAWKTVAGASSSPKWPVGQGAEGNDGVARRVRELPDSIGYVEYLYAITNHLSYGVVRNRSGRFVSPELDSISAAADGASNRIAEDFQTSLTDAPRADAYPIAAFSWFVVPASVEDSAKKEALKQLLNWILGPGQKQAAALGYVSISPDLLSRELRALEAF